MKKVSILTLCLLVGCSTTKNEEGESILEEESSIELKDEKPFLSGINITESLVLEEAGYDSEKYEEFLNLRCFVLGSALVDLSSEHPELQASARDTIENLMARDRERIAASAAQGNTYHSGRLVPRYIYKELEKPEGKQDIRWLSQQGLFLQIAHDFETFFPEAWERAAIELSTFQKPGREFLVAQMIKRLAMGKAEFVSLAQTLLSRYAPEEAHAPLVDACHLRLGNQASVFSRRAAQTLVLIGSPAISSITKVFYDSRGSFLPTHSGNWQTRRHLVWALGEIGDSEAFEILDQDLSNLSFDNDDSRYLYTQVLITALGNLPDQRALEPIARAWKQEPFPDDLKEVAQAALENLTGKRYEHPDDVLSQAR